MVAIAGKRSSQHPEDGADAEGAEDAGFISYRLKGNQGGGQEEGFGRHGDRTCALRLERLP